MNSKQRKKEKLVLVTGCSGMVGRLLMKALLEKNTEVIGCDIKNPSGKDFVFEKCDLASEKDVFRLFKKYNFSQVVHLAACIKTGNLKFVEMEKMFQANLLAVFNLASAMKKNKIKKVILASSMTVYGFPQYLPVDEYHPLNPLDFYGFSKVAAEEIIKNSGINYLILRFPGIFSFNRKEGAIYNFVSNALKGEYMHIFAKNPEPWEAIFLEDVVDSLIAAFESKQKNEIFNIGYGETTNLFSMANNIAKLCGSRSKVIRDFVIKYPAFCLDARKSEKMLDINFPPLNERLKQFINFFKNGR